MKKTISLLMMLLFFITPAIAAAAETAGWSGNVNVLVGLKILDDDEWGDFDQQTENGIMTDFGLDSWPINISVNLLYSRDSTSDFHDHEVGDTYYYTYYAEEASTVELNLGVKKIWTPADRLNFYVAGGIAVIYGEMNITQANNLAGTYNDTETEDDTGVGGWGAVGTYVTFARHFNVGVDLRYSSADIDLYNEEIDAGGFHIGLLVGYAW